MECGSAVPIWIYRTKVFIAAFPAGNKGELVTTGVVIKSDYALCFRVSECVCLMCDIGFVVILSVC